MESGSAVTEVSRLRSAFEQFRDHVEPLAQEIALSVPGYTDHSIDHCDALWDTAGMVAGGDYPVNPAEAFVLGGAFLIHDLAMGLSAYRDGLAGILGSQEWRDFLWAERGQAAASIQSVALSDVNKNPTWDGLTDTDVKASLTVFLRERHAEQATEILRSQWTLTNGESFYLLPDTELRLWYADLIGKIGRSHWLSASELPGYLPGTLGTPAGLPLDWTVDPIKVACLLRLADAAQVDSRRAQPLHTPFRNPRGRSRDHWVFQEHMLHPRCDRGRLEYTASRPFEATEAEAWWLAFDTMVMIDEELRNVDSLCADLGKPRMQARSVAGAAVPERYAQYVPTRGWEPIDARPHIDNPLSIIESLGGEALYGVSEDEVPVRELLANAHDATLARESAHPGGTRRPIRLNFSRDDQGDLVEVRDFGIGMSADTIAKYLCDFGASGWRSPEFRQEYPGALARGYSSTGRFGIGFFSVFMIAEDVSVTSRPLHGGWNDTHVLEFRGGIAHRPILRKATPAERLDEPGTLVRLRPTRPLDDEYGLLYAVGPMTLEQQCAMVRRLALACAVPIEVSPLGIDDYTLVLDGTAWQQIDARALYGALHTDPWYRVDAKQSAVGETAFCDLLSELRNGAGDAVGRLGFRLQGLGDALRSATCYCGGFASGALHELVGVADGAPVRAGRDAVSLDVQIEGLQNWCRDQWARLQSSPLAGVEDRLDFHWFSIGFGVRFEDAPFCYFENQILTPDQLKQELTQRGHVDLIELQLRGSYEIDGNLWLSPFGADRRALMGLPDSVCVVGFGSRSPYDEYPIFEPTDRVLDPPTDALAAWAYGRWNRRIHDPESEFIVCLSEAWDCAIADVLRHSRPRRLSDALDDRIVVPTYKGSDVRLVGISFQRPAST